MHPQPGGRKKTSPPVSPLQVQPVTPALPAQWSYGFLRALPGEAAFLAPVAGGTYRQRSARVAAPGPHDFAVRCQRFVGCKHLTFAASIASRAQRVVTTMIRPSAGQDGDNIVLICVIVKCHFGKLVWRAKRRVPTLRVVLVKVRRAPTSCPASRGASLGNPSGRAPRRSQRGRRGHQTLHN
jgi:hypothetical protein